MSLHGRELLAEWEGCRREVYRDSGGAPTIGFGHLLTLFERRSGQIQLNGRIIDYSKGLSLPECQELFTQDLRPVEAAVATDVTARLEQNQFDALCCFVFNIGVSTFEDIDRAKPGKQPCTLLRDLNAGNYASVPDELAKWVFDNHVRMAGLEHRREKETALWEGRL